jgi:diacylglycerol O-acyltransferase / wax synthase
MSTLQQVDSEDASFLFAERLDNPAHLSLIALYDQSPLDGEVVRFQNLRKLIANRLQTTPILKQKLRRVPADLDYPYWVDDQGFDIDYHVRHLALPQPGDWRQFCIQVARLHSRPLDTRLPLWELYVIEGLNAVSDLPQGSFALYFKVHHCAMDEYTAQEFLCSLHERQPNQAQHEATSPRVRFAAPRAPTPSELAIQGLRGNSLRLLHLARPPWRQGRMVARKLALWTLHKLRHSGDREGAARQGVHFSASPISTRVFEGLLFSPSLHERLAKLVPGCELEHLLTLVCTEATRRYLEHQQVGNPEHIVARIHLPTRHASAHAHAGNAHALREVESYCTVENLLERLTAISNAVIDDVNTEQERHGDLLRARYEGLPAAFNHALRLQSGQRRLFSNGAESVGIHITQGQADPLFLMGARLAGLTAVSPLLDGCALVFSATSYYDRLRLSFTSDTLKLPEPRLLKAELEQLIDELEGVAG